MFTTIFYTQGFNNCCFSGTWMTIWVWLGWRWDIRHVFTLFSEVNVKNCLQNKGNLHAPFYTRHTNVKPPQQESYCIVSSWPHKHTTNTTFFTRSKNTRKDVINYIKKIHFECFFLIEITRLLWTEKMDTKSTNLPLDIHKSHMQKDWIR